MVNRLDQLLQLHKMLMQELLEVQSSAEFYLQRSCKLIDMLKEQWPDMSEDNGLIAYDSLVTSITNIMNMARKFNLLLQLNQPIKHKGKLVNEILEQLTLDKKEEKTNEVDNISSEIDESDDFIYPKHNINTMYQVNDIINASITYVKDTESLTFFIIDLHRSHAEKVKEIAQSLQLYQYHGVPPESEVFGLVLDNRILRAVRSSKSSYDPELDEEFWSCYLLDFGEIVQLQSKDMMYKLCEEQRQTPAQAIQCQLTKTSGNQQELQSKLKDLEYKSAILKVVSVNNDDIQVELIEDNSTALCTGVKSQETRPLLKNREFNPNDLNQEDLDMLYDEPLCTSNAMKAVMGYDPQDDKRICRFYDPKTRACFKGAKCKQEHIPKHPDGWTKDTVLSNVYDQIPEVIYNKGDIITITPTNVAELEFFHAQINGSGQCKTPLIWTDDDVPSWKRLQKPPFVFETVLAKYDDGFWYRARILTHDDDYKIYKVFYVDYGNEQLVHLRSMAKCDHSIAQIPFQAVLLRIAGIKTANITPEEHKVGMAKLCQLILNQTMEVQVLAHNEHLLVSFLEKRFSTIPNMLIEMGCVVPFGSYSK
uniref:C3H1-type domain-containing protein n=1 Tax=Glossina pallidipes TaxID=7398 RepID=A0A1A9Z0M6_GLOPL